MKNRLLVPLMLMALTTSGLFAETAKPEKTIGIDLAKRNLAVKPGDDFEEYANGAWRNATEIPPDRASIGISFEVFQKAEKRNADLVREAGDRKSTRLNSSHAGLSRMPSSA